MLLPKYLRRFLLPMTFSMVPEEGDGGGGGTGTEGDKGSEGDKGGKGTAADMVAKADHDRAIAERDKYKKLADKAAQEKKDADTARLKESNDWKTLAEQREAEAREAVEKAERIQNSYLGERKFNAIREKCAALGLRPEAIADLELLDTTDIQIETTSTGKINVLGVDAFASKLKTTKPHWFAEKKDPNVNTKGGETKTTFSGDETVTPAMLIELERAGKKSGNLQDYHAAFKKYQQQRKAK